MAVVKRKARNGIIDGPCLLLNCDGSIIVVRYAVASVVVETE